MKESNVQTTATTFIKKPTATFATLYPFMSTPRTSFPNMPMTICIWLQIPTFSHQTTTFNMAWNFSSLTELHEKFGWEEYVVLGMYYPILNTRNNIFLASIRRQNTLFFMKRFNLDV